MGGDIDPNEKLTDVKAFMIIIKCFIGPGMLSLPFAIAHAGTPVGFFFSFLFSNKVTILPPQII
jgi:amino acid permease